MEAYLRSSSAGFVLLLLADVQNSDHCHLCSFILLVFLNSVGVFGTLVVMKLNQSIVALFITCNTLWVRDKYIYMCVCVW
jgi:hypothetical protein